MKLGERVRELRERHGWTWRELERASKVSYFTIRRLEEGTHKSIRLFDGVKLAQAFGMTVEDFLKGVDESKDSKAA